MSTTVKRWFYMIALLPCALAGAIGAYAVVQLVQVWPPEGEYAGLAPYLVAVYFGPGLLAALAALLLGTSPGALRLILTGVAALWTVTLTPMLWLGAAS